MSRNKTVDSKGSATLQMYFKKQSPSKKQKDKVDIMSIHSKMRVPKNTGPSPELLCIAQSYLYPKNLEIREYQFLICRTCLFHNTLVCLPTGLGKTHIASVLILNYYRWFPTGKIYFLAPTRPLVFQQKNCLASYKDWINEDQVTEVNGQVPTAKRANIYSSKRVFFMTPQTLDNDLSQGRCQSKDIVLIIFDEAHRAVGNYAYTSIVQKLDKENSCYRLIGLSATPGNCMQKIQQVMTSLHISKIESKDETDPDVRAYTHSKSITPIHIPANALITQSEKLLDLFIERPLIMLISMQVVQGYLVKVIHISGINQGVYFQLYEGWKKMEQRHRERLDKREVGLVYSCLRVMKLILDWKKALREQGYDTFRSCLMQFRDDKTQKYSKIPFKKDILGSETFKKLVELFDKEQTSANHPKLLKLRELLVDFFSKKQNITQQSKVIVFTGYKTSALEIKNFLDSVKEVRSALFVGQSKTITTRSQLVEDQESEQVSFVESISIVQLKQKDQIATIKQFRAYELNTLISTSIGEEGLDIGEVDLIVCYDSGMSPIRMVQRMGRTGRKREGQVYLLLMEGKQSERYDKATKKSQSLKKTIRGNSNDTKVSNKLDMYLKSSVMLKEGIQLPIEYIDNQMRQEQKIVVKSTKKQKKAKKIAKSSKSKSKDTKENKTLKDIKSLQKSLLSKYKEPVKQQDHDKMQDASQQNSQPASVTRLSLNSDRMVENLQDLEKDFQNYQSL